MTKGAQVSRWQGDGFLMWRWAGPRARLILPVTSARDDGCSDATAARCVRHCFQRFFLNTNDSELKGEGGERGGGIIQTRSGDKAIL